MTIARSIGSALAGTFAGLVVLGGIGAKDPGQPALVMSFGGVGAIVGLVLVPRAMAWLRGAFVETPAARPEDDEKTDIDP